MKPMEPMKPMQPMEPMKPMSSLSGSDRWWPESLGDSPNSVGGQNAVRYAYFGDKNRLAVDPGDGKVSVYDTGGKKISGVQQAQSGDGRNVVFTGPQGEIDLGQLEKVDAGN